MIRKTNPALKAEKGDYWRSLEQLAGDPEFRRYLEDEFPSAAPALDDRLDRRQMLTLMGASFALAGLANCRRPVEHIVPYVDAPENVIPGIPKHYATTMPLGLSNYGLLVESHEGRPTKVEGNQEHPSTEGASSAWIQASILNLYDPDRSPSVLQGGQPSSWDNFVSAWQEIEATHLQDQGAGLAVLSESFCSPTLSRLADAFRTRFPQAGWVCYEPVSDENIYEGLRQATGTAHRAVYHYDRAQTILALDADFLYSESDAVSNARRFAAGRRVQNQNDSMSRLYAVESGVSVTGVAADHRLRLNCGQIGPLAAALAAELQSQGVPVQVPQGADAASIPGLDAAWLPALAKDLRQAGSQALVVAGRRQSPAVHALVFALNAALGSLGRTVTFHELRDANLPNRAGLTALVEEINNGTIQTLVILGGNPAYNAPADLRFERALKSVPNTVHLGTHLDETSQAVQWHIPQAHYLESWGDARASDGSLSICQPLIEPLFGALPTAEVLGLIAGQAGALAYDLVEETWEALLPTAGEFETEWRRVLHDGILKDSQLPETVPAYISASASAPIQAPSNGVAGELEIVFEVSSGLYDGRFANNGWLQETPDPLTKLTWDNAALISPATAKGLGVSNGDHLLLTYRGHKLEIPAWIQPGQSDNSLSVALGYGRTHGGRAAIGVGGNAYLLTDSRGGHFDSGVRVSRTGRSRRLSSTQNHGSMEGRQIIRQASLEHYRQNPEFAKGHEPDTQLYDAVDYSKGPQWGMAIDLNACIGCNACMLACQSENNVPVVGREQVGKGREMHWIRIDRYFEGSPEESRAAFQPMPCQHCENAPCEEVCPVAATVHDQEGLNVMVYNRCIGTRYCSNNCPYKVRRFNYFNYTKDTPEASKMAYNPDVTVRSRGVMEKCSYCLQRISAAKLKAKQAGLPLADGDVKTACQQACPSDAIAFGDINDLDSRVSQAKAQNRDYTVLAELNNRPRTSYQARLRNPNPDLEGD